MKDGVDYDAEMKKFVKATLREATKKGIVICLSAANGKGHGEHYDNLSSLFKDFYKIDLVGNLEIRIQGSEEEIGAKVSKFVNSVLLISNLLSKQLHNFKSVEKELRSEFDILDIEED